jgi:hypothetical protein
MFIIKGIVNISYRQGFLILKSHRESNAHEMKKMSIKFYLL